MGLDLGLLAVVAVSSLMTVLVVVLLDRAKRPRVAQAGLGGTGHSVMLFDGEMLLDATPDGNRLLGQAPKGLSDRDRATAVLAPLFPDLTSKLSRLEDGDSVTVYSPDGARKLLCRSARGVLRLTINSADLRPHTAPESHAVIEHELDTLRLMAEHTPTLAWQQNTAGEVIWANRAYVQQVENGLETQETLTWPLPNLFDHEPGLARPEEMSPRRVALQKGSPDTKWFDCTAVPHGDTPILFAQPADAAVRAEHSLRDFRQTLTKTFADLPIGLAIFNRARELVLFNPALVDLCVLETEFLIARPSLTAFLDRLRDKQVMPEPKDYKSWRQKMTALEEQATNGAYQETWTLMTGQTYRVSGRPHPDGAIAFLFEDISSEVSLTRRFRAELELGQATLDGFEQAVAVFSVSGVLSLTNTAYVQLWGHDPSTSLVEISFADACDHWQTACQPTPAWSELHQAVNTAPGRTPQERLLTLHDGRSIQCCVTAITGGGTMVTFTSPSALCDTPKVISAQAM